MKWLAALFALFILGVILAADFGLLAGQVQLIHSLPGGDKLGHFVLIGLLSFLVTISLMRASPQSPGWKTALIVGLLLALLFGIEETSQSFIRGRHADPGDLAADYAGITFFSLLALFFRRIGN